MHQKHSYLTLVLKWRSSNFSHLSSGPSLVTCTNATPVIKIVCISVPGFSLCLGKSIRRLLQLWNRSGFYNAHLGTSLFKWFRSFPTTLSRPLTSPINFQVALHFLGKGAKSGIQQKITCYLNYGKVITWEFRNTLGINLRTFNPSIPKLLTYVIHEVKKVKALSVITW